MGARALRFFSPFTAVISSPTLLRFPTLRSFARLPLSVHISCRQVPPPMRTRSSGSPPLLLRAVWDSVFFFTRLNVAILWRLRADSGAHTMIRACFLPLLQLLLSRQLPSRLVIIFSFGSTLRRGILPYRRQRRPLSPRHLLCLPWGIIGHSLWVSRCTSHHLG